MALIRIPVLIALLVASGPLQWRYSQARFVLTQEGAVASVPPWVMLIALAVVFILAASYGRGQRHATPVLVGEAVIAFIIAIVPPLIWAQVAGGVWTEAMGGTTGTAYSQLLAVVWMMVAIRTLRSQRRG